MVEIHFDFENKNDYFGLYCDNKITINLIGIASRYNPEEYIEEFASVIGSTIFHEFGHYFEEKDFGEGRFSCIEYTRCTDRKCFWCNTTEDKVTKWLLSDQILNLKCDFCGDSIKAARELLKKSGWNIHKRLFPIKLSITACPLHTNEYNKARIEDLKEFNELSRI